MQKALFIYKDNKQCWAGWCGGSKWPRGLQPSCVCVCDCMHWSCVYMWLILSGVSWLLTRHWEFENPVRVKRGEPRRFSPYFNSQTCPFPWVEKEREKSMRHTVLTVASSRSINARWLLLRGWFVLACCLGIQFEKKKKQATNQTKQTNRNCSSRSSLEVQI